MKRFLSSLALTLMWPIWRAPAWAQLTTLGVGGVAAVVIGTLITPSIVPLEGSYFNTSGPNGFTNNGLQTNGGTVGAFQHPSPATNSMVMYIEGQVDPSLTYYAGVENALGSGTTLNARFGISTTISGTPAFLIQNTTGNASGTQWWNGLATDTGSLNPLTTTSGTGYANGYYPYTMTGSGCARDPTGVWTGGGGAAIVDPGFLCSGPTPTVTGLQIPNSGARQATGLAATPTPLAATSCVPNSPISTEMTVTAQVSIAHGILPGQTYTLQGFTGTGFTGYNATYTALPGTSGTTLVGETTTGGGTCPTSPLDTSAHEGTALNGINGSVTAATISTTNPWTRGMTGITSKAAQHFCGVIGEYGADSAFPGAQFASFVDDKGNPLPGAPATVPWLNQSTANFTGYVQTGTQSSTALTVSAYTSTSMTLSTAATLLPGARVLTTTSGITGLNGAVIVSETDTTHYVISGATGSASSVSAAATASFAALVVTSMNSYAISAASFNSTTGYVTFTTTTSPGFIPGSEFTVSGVSPTGYNQTYVAVAGTSGTTLVANPLNGPVGVPQAISNPGSYVSGGGLVSVILPGMEVWGAASTALLGQDAMISPYQTFSSTGTGGVGTYGLTTNQSGAQTFTATGASGATQITATGGTVAKQPIVVGDAITGTGIATGTIITSLGTGTGGNGTYNINNPLTATLSGSANVTMAGTIGSSAAPVNIFAFSGGYYFTGAGSTNAAGGVVTARTQAALGDFFNQIGSINKTISQGQSGWGGALANVSMIWGSFPQSTGGAPSTTALASLCTKITDINSFAAAQTAAGNTMSVHSLYRLNDPGLWADSSAAMFQGYISGASGATATLNVSGSPQYGALTGSGTVVVAGPGIPGCPLACPTTTLGSGPTYALTWASSIAANVGSSGSPVTMTAGAYKPAKPTPTNPFNGYIDSPGGVPTLHVTSIPSTATMTGTLGNLITSGHIDNGTLGTAGKTLTVVLNSPVPQPRYAQIAVGSLLTGNGVAAGTHVTAMSPSINPDTGLALTGNGLTGTYAVDTSQTVASGSLMFVSGILPAAANALQTDNSSVVGGPLGVASWVSDGGLNITGEPLILTFLNTTSTTGFSNWAINQTYMPPFTNDTALAATQTVLVPGMQLFGPGITTPVSIAGLGTLTPCPTTGFTGCGTYILSNNASNGIVGSSGSPVALNATGVQDGPAVAPGRALTIRDPGAAVAYPVTSISCSALSSCTGTGPVAMSGTFDTALLGGTPTTIQAQISLSPGGPPVSGCSACAWTNLSGYSATLSAGTVFNWSGQALNIPGSSGPLYVSVRAANGTAYATMPTFIKMGLVFDWQGDFQFYNIGSTPGLGNATGSANSYFTGLWGLDYLQSNTFNPLDAGPAISGTVVPSATQMFAGDAFGEQQGGVPIAEASNVYEQLLANAFGWAPAVLQTTPSTNYSLAPQLLGNVVQNQTIAAGGGSNTVFCSANKFCANFSASGPLVFTAATQTGASITALIDDGTGTSTAGNVLTTSARPMGALEPGMTLTGSGIAANTTLVACTTGCGPVSGVYPAIQKWTTSGSGQFVASESMRADLGATPWPNYNIQSQSTSGSTYSLINASLWTQFIKAGTFKVTDMTTGLVVCQDTNAFAYNVQSGNCTGTGVTGFVDYVTGDYQINFTAAQTHPLVASWTNIISPDNNGSVTSRPQGLDFFGDGTKTSGAMSSVFDTAPGGVSGHVYAGGLSDAGILTGDYAIGASGYTQGVSWLYGTKFPSVLPGESASTPFISMDYWRSEGMGGNVGGNTTAWRLNQWAMDSTTKSTWTGYISAGTPNGVLTLSSAAVAPMWEGEPIGAGGSPTGDYIIDLKAGTWGASGSTYDVGNCGGSSTTCTPTNVAAVASSGSPVAMNNSAYYLGSGPAFYAGPINDDAVSVTDINVTHSVTQNPTNGFTGGRRVAARLAAATYGGLTSLANASDPSLDRTKADVGTNACDAAALAGPCFDDGKSGTGTLDGGPYKASHSGTIAGTQITVTGGISLGSRPFVVGQQIFCSGCTTGRFITSIDVPPTMSAAARAGEVGQTFHITANASLLTGPTTETVTAGCSGTSGTGSNCVDVAIQINTTNGSYATAAALATCGEGNLNGSAPPYRAPNGLCQTNGVGSLVRSIRIGTQQSMSAGLTGSVWDDGLDSNGGFTQSAAFTCNIVAAKVVQCVKGAVYTSGVPSSIGQWASASTFIEYGDPVVGTGRIATLMGSVGGQSLPFTPGSGYTNGSYPGITGACTLGTSGTQPKIDITVAGGAIVNVYPSSASNALGLAVAGSCTFSLATLGAGTGGAITALTLGPSDGAAGIATYNSDSNMMGDLLYDNSGLVGNPLNMFFTNKFGGYFEPGLPVRPWGNYLGAQVSG